MQFSAAQREFILFFVLISFFSKNKMYCIVLCVLFFEEKKPFWVKDHSRSIPGFLYNAQIIGIN